MLRRMRGQSKHCKIGKERRRKNKKDARRVRLTTRKCQDSREEQEEGEEGRGNEASSVRGQRGNHSNVSLHFAVCFARWLRKFSAPLPLADFLLPPAPEDKGAKFSLHFECSVLNSAASTLPPSLFLSLCLLHSLSLFLSPPLSH